jgi:ABC-type sugar transport system substrate-binding protein
MKTLLLLATCVVSSQAAMQRRIPMMGGYSPADVNDPFVTSAAQFAVASGSKNQYSFALGNENVQVRVLKADQQVLHKNWYHDGYAIYLIVFGDHYHF